MVENTTGDTYERELRVVIELARGAGKEALRYYGTALHVEHKGNINEPVTEADYAANDLIMRGLREEFPEDGFLSEESVDSDRRLTLSRVWMIDPLDGTRGFISGSGDFAVQIGLTVEGECVLGVVYQPAQEVMQWASRGGGAWSMRDGETKRLRVSDESDLERVRLAASRSHRSPRMDQAVRALGIKNEVQCNSVGVKISLIVEQQCDLYVHLSAGTNDWDTCAPEAILREAGGRMTDIFGEPLTYNLPDAQHRNGIVASNTTVHDQVIQKLAPLLVEFERTRV